MALTSVMSQKRRISQARGMSAKGLIPEKVLSFVPEYSGNEQADQDVENLASRGG
jgi:hypothetical protein